MTTSDAPAQLNILDLDTDGVLKLGGERIRTEAVAERLQDEISLGAWATDIFVYAHGWQTPPDTAEANARWLLDALQSGHSAYAGLEGFAPHMICIRWPSQSKLAEFDVIRDRAHSLSDEGHAAHVLGTLLGYLDGQRVRPETAATLATADGQYLHCVGHSFGCRVLGEAIVWAADPPMPDVLGWPWEAMHPFAVDDFLALQMAAPPDFFEDRFAPLIDGSAPVAGPIVLTFSKHDKALRLPHRFREGRPGIGAVGADGAHSIRLHRTDEPYREEEFERLTNVDASWRFTGGWPLVGAHSKIWHPETVHLLLSLAELGRVP